MKQKQRALLVNYLERGAVIVVVLSALYSIGISALRVPGMPDNVHGYLEINRIMQRMLGLMQLFVAWRLYKRMRMAWLITLGASTVLLTLQIISGHSLGGVAAACELFIIVALILCWRDFGKRSDRISIQKAAIIAGFAMILVVINVSMGFFTLWIHRSQSLTFWDCLENTVRVVLSLEPVSVFQVRALDFYMDFAAWFTWLSLFACLILMLKPLLYNPITDLWNRERALELVRQYGQNPMSYLAVERDKRYFFGAEVEGVAAYGVAGGVAVCCGDPICAHEDLPLFLSEFMDFCHRNEYAIVLLNVTDRFMDIYRSLGFESVKYGEDACFLLSEYKLSGGGPAKVRAAINHANKAGITVCEYRPTAEPSQEIEREIQEISRAWLEGKNGGEMGFMLGGNGLEEPLDRRYFTARAADGRMLGYVVFLPYDSGRAYLADVTRRRKDAPQGVLEKIIWDAFQVFREEGVLWGNMGLVPLANLQEESREKMAAKVFQFVYENLNSIYGFKALHHAKEKYAPTHWQTRYMAYHPKIFTPQMAYAIVKLQNPGGIRKMFPAFKISGRAGAGKNGLSAKR